MQEEVYTVRKGIFSLAFPGMKRSTGSRGKNMERAEKAANHTKAEVVEKAAPVTQEPAANEQFVQTIRVPKQQSLLKAVNRRHRDMSARARRRQEELDRQH